MRNYPVFDAAAVLPNGMRGRDVNRYVASGTWQGLTHWEAAARAIDSFGSSVCAIDLHRSLTYAQLGRRVPVVAGYLASKGLAPGDNVVMHLANSVTFFECFWALHYMGCHPVMGLPTHSARVVSSCASAAPARFVLVDEGRAAARFVSELANIDPIITPITVGILDERWYDQRLEQPAEQKSYGLGLFQLSGGTTGTPKLIARTHDDYLCSIAAQCAVCDVEPGDVVAAVLPASHNFTMSSPGIIGAFLTGATVVFADNPSPMTVLPLVEKHRVTHMALVPPLANAYLDSALVDTCDVSSLKTIWVGGAKMSPARARQVAPVLRCKLQQVFGMAEGLVCFTRLDDDETTIIETQGRPAGELNELRLLPVESTGGTGSNDDSTTADSSPSTSGVLAVKGPYTIGAYHNNPTANTTSFTRDGYYITGDIVTIDERGNLTVTGRVKDLINRGGEKIAPVTVEEALAGIEGIVDVNVVGVADDNLGEKIKAFIIPAPGASFDLKTIRAYGRERGLSSFELPDSIELVDHFDHTAVGKVKKTRAGRP